MKPTPEAVGAFVVGLIGVAEPFLTRLGVWLGGFQIVFPENYINGRLTPFLTMVGTFWAIRLARTVRGGGRLTPDEADILKRYRERQAVQEQQQPTGSSLSLNSPAP